MRITPEKDGGRRLTGNTPFGKYEVTMQTNAVKAKVIDQNGKQIGEVTLKMRSPLRPPQPIPDDYDPKSQRRGCCDPPDPAMKR